MFLFSLRWFMCVFRRRCCMNIWNPRKFKNFVLYKFSHIITCSLGNYHFIMLWSEIFGRVVFSDLMIPFFIWMSLQIHFPFIVKNYQLRNEFYDGEPILERFHQSKLWGIHYTKNLGNRLQRKLYMKQIIKLETIHCKIIRMMWHHWCPSDRIKSSDSCVTTYIWKIRQLAKESARQNLELFF